VLRILLCGTGWLEVTRFIEKALVARGVEASLTVRDARPLAMQLADVDVALPSNAHFGALEIASAPNLRLIQQPAAGYEGIDRAAAHARGIPVCNAPGSNVDAVAQAALLLILGLARRYPLARAAFAEARIGTPIGMELGGRTLGIVGVGRTGTKLQEVATALGMKVEGVRSQDGRAGLLSMLARADVVSIHCPLTEQTRHLFDDEAFSAMKPGALLINVARGGILDRLALERALESGRLGGVGLDVFWQEPWRADDPLFARPDVMVLPHVAGSTVEAFTRIAHVVAHNVAALRDGSPFLHRIE
jgi:phosphoglycerate dehydrogenase-like enzyme